MTKYLPKTEYPSWPALVEAATHHGIANMDPVVLGKYATEISKDVVDSFSPRENQPLVRPSSGINCAAIPWMAKNGHKPSDDTGNPLLFASGHFHHNLIYAALESALPSDSFVLGIENEIPLPDWWPDDPRFSQEGHRDLLVTILEPGWLAPQLPDAATWDIKSKHNLGMAKVNGKFAEFNLSSDVWGNCAQIAVYEETQDIDAYILFTNREVPQAGGKKQFSGQKIWAHDLDEIREKVKYRVGAEEFDPELWLRSQDPDDKVYTPCKNYCRWSGACEELRISNGFQV